MAKELEGIPGISPTLKAFVPVVRTFLRDHAELNRLLAGMESGDRFLAWAICDAISDFNGTPHVTNYSIDDMFNRHLQHLLLRLTVITVLESVGMLQTRNHINYSNGGINVGVNDKTPLIMQWLQYFKASAEQKLQRAKVAINIESILGTGNSGVHSELLAINSSYLPY